MSKLEAKPNDFQCTIAEVPVGPFFHYPTGSMGIKTTKNERSDDQRQECIGLDGNPFMAGTSSFNERDQLIVIPLTVTWEA